VKTIIRNLPRIVGIERGMWYARLSRVNLEIVTAREAISKKIRQIGKMEEDDKELELAYALLMGFEGRLREHLVYREFVMENLRLYPKLERTQAELDSLVRFANDNART
jgi:hypothetical protein